MAEKESRLNDELSEPRTTDTPIKLTNKTWDLGPSGGGKTGKVPDSIPSVKPAAHQG